MFSKKGLVISTTYTLKDRFAGSLFPVIGNLFLVLSGT